MYRWIYVNPMDPVGYMWLCTFFPCLCVEYRSPKSDFFLGSLAEVACGRQWSVAHASWVETMGPGRSSLGAGMNRFNKNEHIFAKVLWSEKTREPLRVANTLILVNICSTWCFVSSHSQYRPETKSCVMGSDLKNNTWNSNWWICFSSNLNGMKFHRLKTN